MTVYVIDDIINLVDENIIKKGVNILKREQLRNNILVIGELTEKKVVRSNVGTNDEAISLTLTVKTSEYEAHTISFFSYKYNMNESKQRLTSNNVSKMYLGYDTVANEYNAYLTTTVINKEEQPKVTNDKAELVEITGNLRMNRYVNKEGKLIEIPQLNGRFCSRLKDTSSNFGATWDCHMFIREISDKEDITGSYTLIKGIVVDYTEEEYEFRIYSDKVRNTFNSKYSEREAANFMGKIVNRVEVAEEQSNEEAEWGTLDVTTRKVTTQKRYFELTRGDSKPMDTDDEEHPLSIENARVYRKNIKAKQEAIMKKHQEAQTKTAFASIDDEEAPF